MNKYQQKFAMDEFVAGNMAPGEMGNGIVLEDMVLEEKLKMNTVYFDHAFNQYISDMISVNRSCQTGGMTGARNPAATSPQQVPSSEFES